LKDIYPLLFSDVKYADLLNDLMATSFPVVKHWAWYTQAVIPLPILRRALKRLWNPNWTMYLWPRTLAKCSKAVLAYGFIRHSIGLLFFRQILIPWGSPTLPGATDGLRIISNWWL